MEERFVQVKSLHLIGLIALAVAPLYGQQYWSTTEPDCSSLGAPFTQAVQPPGVSGYSCSVTGTFVWLAAGGPWGTVIRVAAPASNPVGVDYLLYDQTGALQSMDTTINNGSVSSGNEVDFALYANQPAELEMLGATRNAPNYGTTATGSVYATFYCPDALTCSNVLPQLIYSALPTYDWSLSVPIAWDDALSNQWSAEGIDDGSTNVVSLVIYNETTLPAQYNIDIYDSNGNPYATYTTPNIAGFNSVTEEAGTYAVLLDSVFSSLPSGVFKILVDGGSALSAVEVLQINGPSATTLQVAYDTSPSSTSDKTGRRSAAKRLHMHSSNEVFKGLPKK